jgi:hypothetical protein
MKYINSSCQNAHLRACKVKQIKIFHHAMTKEQRKKCNYNNVIIIIITIGKQEVP